MRGDISAFVRGCDVCDLDRNLNPNPNAALGHLPADQPCASLYIVIIGVQRSLSLGANPTSIVTMIGGLIGLAEAVPVDDQRAKTVARVVY